MADSTSPKKAKKSEAEVESEELNAILGASSQVLFVILPFIVIAITLGHRGQLWTLFSLPEWSIVSAVIVGQTTVRVVSVVLGKDVYKEPIMLIVSALLVCLLVPTLVVLSIVLTSDHISLTLAVTQAVLFLLSLASFWYFAWIEIQAQNAKS